MKIFLLCIILLLSGCTDNRRARTYGGTEQIQLPKGQRLLMATWKESDLWYLTEPMDSVYVPQTKSFKESSSFGVWQGTVIFIESK